MYKLKEEILKKIRVCFVELFSTVKFCFWWFNVCFFFFNSFLSFSLSLTHSLIHTDTHKEGEGEKRVSQISK